MPMVFFKCAAIGMLLAMNLGAIPTPAMGALPDSNGVVPTPAFISAPDWPHTGAFGYGTRYLYLKNFLRKKIAIDVAAGSAPKNQHFTLQAGRDTVFEVPNNWPSARMQARTDSISKGPYSLVEWTLSSGTPRSDFYDISLVDGYNLPIEVKPVRGTYNQPTSSGQMLCGTGGCQTDLLLTCPAELQQKDSSGNVVACLSACSEFNTDAYCCRGAYDKPQSCNASVWEKDYPHIFKMACPSSYSYAYDDSTSLFMCPEDANTKIGPDYAVTFGLAPADIFNRPSATAARIPFNVSMSEDGALRYAFSAFQNSPLWISIYSAAGELISETEIKSSRGTITLRGLSPGSYVAALRAGDGILKARLTFSIQ